MIGISVISKTVLFAALALSPLSGGAPVADPAPEVAAAPAKYADSVAPSALADADLAESFAAFGCVGRFSTSSSWYRLILTIEVQQIQNSYARYSGIAYHFIDCAPEGKYNRFWNAHNRGDRRTARQVLRNWAANN